MAAKTSAIGCTPWAYRCLASTCRPWYGRPLGWLRWNQLSCFANPGHPPRPAHGCWSTFSVNQVTKKKTSKCKGDKIESTIRVGHGVDFPFNYSNTLIIGAIFLIRIKHNHLRKPSTGSSPKLQMQIWFYHLKVSGAPTTNRSDNLTS